MFISCLYAVRDALRKTQSEDLLNEYEEDFVAWCYEAEKKILADTFASGELKNDNIVCLTTRNNQVNLPQGFYSLICCKVLNQYPELINRRFCRIKADCACSNLSPNQGLQVRIDGLKMTFSPAIIPDSTPVTIEYQSIRLEGEDGYPMIFEEHLNAVSEYVQWQILSNLKRDLQWSELKRRDWMLSCPQARARTNQLTPQEKQRIGLIWNR